MRFLLLYCLIVALLLGCSGEKAPDVQFVPLGKTTPVKLSDFKGKVVLIDFWATWCGPCRATMPSIQKLYDEFKDKGFEVVAISEENPVAVERFVKNSLYTYRFYLDADSSVNAAFKITQIPTTVLIDRNGNVVLKDTMVPEEELRKAISGAVE